MSESAAADRPRSAQADAPSLERELSLGRLASVAAFLSVVLLIATIMVGNASTSGGQGIKAGSKADKLRQLTDVHNSPTGQLATTILHSASWLVGIGMALFLFWIVRGRGAPSSRWLQVVCVLGPVLLAAATLYGFYAITDVSDAFFASGPRNADRAAKMLDDSGLMGATLPFNIISRIVFAAGIGTLCVYATRVGLLFPFLGYLGVGAVVLGIVIPIGDSMYIAWLASVGFLTAGWWPGGRPEAWSIPPS